MPILDIYPTQGCYAPSEVIKLLVEVAVETTGTSYLRLEIQHLAEPAEVRTYSVELISGHQTVPIEWSSPLATGGYAVRAELQSTDGTPISQAATVLDVLPCWTAFPRYGFLSDFSKHRLDPDTTLLELARFHINGLLFYDWQYRHDQLLAPSDEYIDPLGRPLSIHTVRKLVEAAHRHGMAAMPYLTVYAASAKFWRSHLDWALFDETGHPIPFGDHFLGLMNPSKDNPWCKHILGEAKHTLGEIPFDGLHIDQYGEPKRAWDAQHEPVNLPHTFVEFIQAARIQHPDKAILFNAVGNWPIEALATAPLDFLYIEVWPPEVEYNHLARIVLNAVQRSYGKPVVIALYLPADYPTNILLADAVILACGGTRIELGEQARLLADPYFPRHQQIPPELLIEMRRFYDYAVRSGEWLGSYNLSTQERKIWADGELNPGSVFLGGSVWSVVHHLPDGLCISLVNMTGLDNPCWNVAHPAPTPCQELPVRLKYPQEPGWAFWACPEQDSGPQALDFKFDSGELRFVIPYLRYSGVINIHD